MAIYTGAMKKNPKLYTNKLQSNFQKGRYMRIFFILKLTWENSNFNCIIIFWEKKTTKKPQNPPQKPRKQTNKQQQKTHTKPTPQVIRPLGYIATFNTTLGNCFRIKWKGRENEKQQKPLHLHKHKSLNQQG